MRIENYLGFPTGITGSELADRAILQANKFGARLAIATPVRGLMFDQTYPVVPLDGSETITTKCLLIATGVDYRRLDVEGFSTAYGSAAVRQEKGRLPRQKLLRISVLSSQRPIPLWRCIPIRPTICGLTKAMDGSSS